MGVLDNLFIFREFILPGNEGAGTSLLYHMMEYHRDPELENACTRSTLPGRPLV